MPPTVKEDLPVDPNYTKRNLVPSTSVIHINSYEHDPTHIERRLDESQIEYESEAIYVPASHGTRYIIHRPVTDDQLKTLQQLGATIPLVEPTPNQGDITP